MFELNNQLKAFLENSLQTSLHSIGFDKSLIRNLLQNLDSFNFESFKAEFFEQLDNVHEIGFYQKIVPNFYKQYVIPHIPSCNIVLDIGCGTGILAKKLSESNKFEKIVGIDLVTYPEWNIFKNEKVEYLTVSDISFTGFINNLKPDTAILTWTLHHMPYTDQQVYLSNIKKNLKKGSIVVILEDSYSENLPPKTGIDLHKQFMALSEKDRHTVMSVLDWISNRVLSRNRLCPVTFTYRTLEAWSILFEETGFEILNTEYIGFPLPKNINEPQSLFVLRSTS